MEMPISHRIYSKILEEGIVWKSKRRCARNSEHTVQIQNVEIIAGAVCVDHVHLSIAIPPKLSVSDFMGYLKSKSTLMIYDRHPELQSKWDKAFWARILCRNNR